MLYYDNNYYTAAAAAATNTITITQVSGNIFYLCL